MTKSRFRLEPVLRIRRIEERAAAVDAARAAAAATEADQVAQARLAAAQQARAVSRVDGVGFQLAMLRSTALGADATQSREMARQAAQAADEERATWTQAAQRAKGLERLRERHVAKVQQQVLAAEERIVDDLVTRAYAARTQEGMQQH